LNKLGSPLLAGMLDEARVIPARLKDIKPLFRCFPQQFGALTFALRTGIRFATESGEKPADGRININIISIFQIVTKKEYPSAPENLFPVYHYGKD